MKLHKFSDVDAFVALDLPDAEAASGPVRWARKILQGGAKDLARSQTYTYAALQMRRSGASAGINAEAPRRAEALAAFVDEAAALVADGTYLPDAAKGVSEHDLAPLRDTDPRSATRLGAVAAECDGLSAAVAADAARPNGGHRRILGIRPGAGRGCGRARRTGRWPGHRRGIAGRSTASIPGLSPRLGRHCDKALSALAGNNDGAGKPTRCGASVPTWWPDPRWGSSTTEWPRHSNAGPSAQRTSGAPPKRWRYAVGAA